MIPLSGSFDVHLDDGNNKKIIMLNKPDKGLLIPKGIWREMDNFSSAAVCMVLASDYFKESDILEITKNLKSLKLFKLTQISQSIQIK